MAAAKLGSKTTMIAKVVLNSRYKHSDEDNFIVSCNYSLAKIHGAKTTKITWTNLELELRALCWSKDWYDNNIITF